MMEYKGYNAIVELDEDSGVLHGEVVNLRDVVTFEGETVAEIRAAFQDSVDDYLEFCHSRGENPEKPYSGRFVVRVNPVLHKKIAVRAKLSRKSLNAWVAETLEAAAK